MVEEAMGVLEVVEAMESEVEEEEEEVKAEDIGEI